MGNFKLKNRMKSFVSTLAVAALVAESEAFDLPRTRMEAIQNLQIPKSIHANSDDKSLILEKAHHHTLRASEHRVEIGKKMGLPAQTPYYELLTQGHNHALMQGEEGEGYGIGGAMGAIIGLFNGMQFQNTGTNQRIGTVGGFLQSSENFVFLAKKSYMPWYWEDIVYNVQDWTATTGESTLLAKLTSFSPPFPVSSPLKAPWNLSLVPPAASSPTLRSATSAETPTPAPWSAEPSLENL